MFVELYFTLTSRRIYFLHDLLVFWGKKFCIMCVKVIERTNKSMPSVKTTTMLNDELTAVVTINLSACLYEMLFCEHFCINFYINLALLCSLEEISLMLLEVTHAIQAIMFFKNIINEWIFHRSAISFCGFVFFS